MNSLLARGIAIAIINGWKTGVALQATSFTSMWSHFNHQVIDILKERLDQLDPSMLAPHTLHLLFMDIMMGGVSMSCQLQCALLSELS